MAVRMTTLRGRERLEAVTSLLQRIRLDDPTAGVWEAADVQWWWRRPRATDDLPLPVWIDDAGPRGAAVLTDWGDRWQADALVSRESVDVAVVWRATLEAAVDGGAPSVEVVARDDDVALLSLLEADGFQPTDEESGTTWMEAADRPAVTPPPGGFRIVDRASRSDRPHPMAVRNGDEVEARLRQCSLYEPELDLSIETADGDPVGYALFWSDPVTGVGMLEPMRVEDEYQRRGLARALLTEGLDRLATRGARRLKVGFDGEAGRTLYLGAGFEVDAMARSFRRAP